MYFPSVLPAEGTSLIFPGTLRIHARINVDKISTQRRHGLPIRVLRDSPFPTFVTERHVTKF